MEYPPNYIPGALLFLIFIIKLTVDGAEVKKQAQMNKIIECSMYIK